MKNSLILLFIFLIIIFSYHLIRDVFQIMGISHPIIDLWHRTHDWCRTYCDYVTLAPELFGIIGSAVVLKQNKLGAIGIAVLASLAFWLFAVLLP